MKILVSRCLLGINCKYNGGNNYTESVVSLANDKNHKVISICPESMGGLSIPRVPSEIGSDGVAYSKDGVSVDAEFRRGAQKCLEIAQREQPDLCILKSKSPSCGVHKRYDGSFQGVLVDKPGVTAQLLMENGFRCIEPEELGDLGADPTSGGRPHSYQDINAETIDRWIEEGWEWGKSISHEEYVKATEGEWDVVLTPQKAVPHEWFGELKSKKILGLASGGGQQMPVFAALGAECTVLDYSERQLESERVVAEREGYEIEIVRADMTKPLPFEDGSFDLIFAPVSTCYIEEVLPLHKECARILRAGGVLLGGYDQVINYVVDDDQEKLTYKLPFNPLRDAAQMEMLQRGDYGVQFSHTLEEQLGGLIAAGFAITGFYEDMSSEGKLAEMNIPGFYAVRAVKVLEGV